MIGVCGVIGYIGTTSGSICRIASATACPPVRTPGSDIAHHLDRVRRTDCGTHFAALAIVEVEAGKRRPVQHDGRVRAVEPAQQAVDAPLELDRRLQSRPPTPGPEPG